MCDVCSRSRYMYTVLPSLTSLCYKFTLWFIKLCRSFIELKLLLIVWLIWFL